MSSGKEIIDYFVAEIAKEGITEVQAWQENDDKTNKIVRDLLCNGEPSPNEIFSIEAETEELQISDGIRKLSVKVKKPKEGKFYCQNFTYHSWQNRLQIIKYSDNYQLDTEYIQRYLGELTVMQESRLVQLRKWVADLQKGKVRLKKS